MEANWLYWVAIALGAKNINSIQYIGIEWKHEFTLLGSFCELFRRVTWFLRISCSTLLESLVVENSIGLIEGSELFWRPRLRKDDEVEECDRIWFLKIFDSVGTYNIWFGFFAFSSKYLSSSNWLLLLRVLFRKLKSLCESKYRC